MKKSARLRLSRETLSNLIPVPQAELMKVAGGTGNASHGALHPNCLYTFLYRCDSVLDNFCMTVENCNGGTF